MIDPVLDNLHDIILPQPPDQWPPAPGVWLLVIVLIVIAIALIWVLTRELQRRWPIWRARRAALIELQRIVHANAEGADAHPQSARLMALLRRAALSIFPRETCAGLTGMAWFEFLDRHAPTPFLTTPAGFCWLDAPYGRPSEAPPAHKVTELAGYTESWLRHNLRGRRR